MTEERGAELFQPFIDAYYAQPSEEENRAEPLAGAGQAEESSPEPRGEEAAPPPSYIHLKNARVYHGQSQIPQRFDGILWRGRLSMINGFTVGEVQQERA